MSPSSLEPVNYAALQIQMQVKLGSWDQLSGWAQCNHKDLDKGDTGEGVW